jgi:hypothetical protein
LATDHADIGQRIVQHLDQAIHVVLVAARDQDNVRMFVKARCSAQFDKFLAEGTGDDLLGSGKARRMGVLRGWAYCGRSSSTVTAKSQMAATEARGTAIWPAPTMIRWGGCTCTSTKTLTSPSARV